MDVNNYKWVAVYHSSTMLNRVLEILRQVSRWVGILRTKPATISLNKSSSLLRVIMVKDREDKDVIRVAGRLDMRDSKTAFDPEGIKLAFFQNKMLSLRKNYIGMKSGLLSAARSR